MKILALDLSIRTGGAVFNTASPQLLVDAFDIDFKHKSPLSTNLMEKPLKLKSKVKRNLTKYDPSNHPKDFISFVREYIGQLLLKIYEIKPDEIVLEQTNKGRDRWRQKLLEWLHYELCTMIMLDLDPIKLSYIDTMEWHKILEIKLSKEDRLHNKKIRQNNKIEANQKMIGIKDDKDVAIKWVRSKFGYELMKKENDIADAICLGYAYIMKKHYIVAEV